MKAVTWHGVVVDLRAKRAALAAHLHRQEILRAQQVPAAGAGGAALEEEVGPSPVLKRVRKGTCVSAERDSTTVGAVFWPGCTTLQRPSDRR
jgi:hypothetical protein